MWACECVRATGGVRCDVGERWCRASQGGNGGTQHSNSLSVGRAGLVDERWWGRAVWMAAWGEQEVSSGSSRCTALVARWARRRRRHRRDAGVDKTAASKQRRGKDTETGHDRPGVGEALVLCNCTLHAKHRTGLQPISASFHAAAREGGFYRGHVAPARVCVKAWLGGPTTCLATGSRLHLPPDGLSGLASTRQRQRQHMHNYVIANRDKNQCIHTTSSHMDYTHS